MGLENIFQVIKLCSKQDVHLPDAKIVIFVVVVVGCYTTDVSVSVILSIFF